MFLPTIDTTALNYTWHATERMRALCISQEDVRRALRHAGKTWPGRRQGSNTSHHYANHRIIVLLSGDGRTVITVKLVTAKPYIHGVHTIRNLPTEHDAA